MKRPNKAERPIPNDCKISTDFLPDQDLQDFVKKSYMYIKAYLAFYLLYELYKLPQAYK